MCTGLSIFKNNVLFFGRNLDYEFSFKENICIVPRFFALKYQHLKLDQNHLAFMGVAHLEDDYPLFYDGMNEKGLCIAGLNFVGNTFYSEKTIQNKINLAQFEFIPYVLANFSSVDEFLSKFPHINVTNESFSNKLTCAKLHYIISDKDKCLVIEFKKEGIKIYENKIGVLTNNPSFDIQLFNLNNYSHLSNKDPLHLFPYEHLEDYSRGMGSIGLPGDPSSMSRFVKASFVLNNLRFNQDNLYNISQFFHALSSVEQQLGIAEVKNGKYEYTIYSNCYSNDSLRLYYKTYSNSQINVISMNNVDIESNALYIYDFIEENKFNFQN